MANIINEKKLEEAKRLEESLYARFSELHEDAYKRFRLKEAENASKEYCSEEEKEADYRAEKLLFNKQLTLSRAKGKSMSLKVKEKDAHYELHYDTNRMDTPDKVRWAVRNFVSYLHLFLDDADTVWEDEAIAAEFLDGIKQIVKTVSDSVE